MLLCGMVISDVDEFCCPDVRVTTWALCIDPPFAKLIRGSWFAKVVGGFGTNPGNSAALTSLRRDVYLVPFVEDEHTMFLKTIIPSRKATKQYLCEESDDESPRRHAACRGRRRKSRVTTVRNGRMAPTRDASTAHRLS